MKNKMFFIFAFILLFIGLSSLIIYREKKTISNDDFLLIVDFNNNIKINEKVTFYCELTFPKRMKVEHSSQLISYEINGNRETITGQGVVEYISKGQVIKRNINLTFEKKGNYTIIFFSEFKSENNESKYKIKKEVNITVQ